MKQPKHLNRALLKRAGVYLLMTLAVVGLSSALLLILLGYRFNGESGTIQQGGLVQFISQPTGAKVTVGTAELANRTRSKITLNPGSYLVKMSLDGYQTWQKQAVVKAGAVLWLNSARFVPESPTTDTITTLKELGSTAVRADGNYLAYIESATTPTISLLSVNDDSPKTTTVTLPASLYHAGSSHVFTLQAVSHNDRYVLMSHAYDQSTESIMVNTQDVTKSVILGGDQSAQVAQVLMNPADDDSVFLRFNDGTVKAMKLSTGVVSSTLISGVAEINTTPSGTLLYVTLPQLDTVQTGYISANTTQPRELNSYKTTDAVHISGAKYYNDAYISTSVGSTISLTQYTDLPASNDAAPIRSSIVRTINAKSPIVFLSTRTSGRFVVAQSQADVTTYDIETATQSDTPIAGSNVAVTSPLSWLDDYHFWSDANTLLRQYEFDGTNQANITPVASGYSAMYSKNGKYLYSIGRGQTGVTIQRTKMITN